MKELQEKPLSQLQKQLEHMNLFQSSLMDMIIQLEKEGLYYPLDSDSYWHLFGPMYTTLKY